MKNFLLTISTLLFSGIFFSCNNFDNDYQMNNLSKHEIDSMAIKKANYENFMLTMDSLNHAYTFQSATRAKGLFDYIGGKICQSTADNAGRVVGGYVGKNVGTVIGGLGGNPVTTVFGYVAGRYVGRLVGACLASYAAYRVLNMIPRQHPSGNPNQQCMGQNYFILPNSAEEDSLGYYHNKIMEIMMETPEKYVDDNNELCYDIIYDDCVEYARIFGIFNDSITKSIEYKTEVINYAKQSTNMVKQAYINNQTEEYLYEKMALQLEERKIPKESVQLFKEFALEVSKTCASLSTTEKIEYAKEVNNVIQSSELPVSMKEEAASTTMMLVNSSICWDETDND